jgi:putative transposase
MPAYRSLKFNLKQLKTVHFVVILSRLVSCRADKKLPHVRGAPFHPRTHGKIERWHQTFKNRIPLGYYYLPGDREAQVEAFVKYYNHQRYHESLKIVTPVDPHFGRAEPIIKQRERISRQYVPHD